MRKQKYSTRWLAGVALFVAIELVLEITGVGHIPLPVIKATTMHIPVIVGAVLLGPLAGGILGATFGLCSMWVNTVTPSLLSFALSPFMSMSGAIGAVKAVWIAVGCRILIGVVSGWLWIGLKKLKLPKGRNVPDLAALPIVGFVGSMTNTVTVMGSIYFLLRPEYAQVKNVGMEAVLDLVMLTVTTSGVAEAAAAMVLVTALGKALLPVAKRQVWEEGNRR